jgi:hypothetical protein
MNIKLTAKEYALLHEVMTDYIKDIESEDELQNMAFSILFKIERLQNETK